VGLTVGWEAAKPRRRFKHDLGWRWTNRASCAIEQYPQKKAALIARIAGFGGELCFQPASIHW
jgi:hypothetical protein